MSASPEERLPGGARRSGPRNRRPSCGRLGCMFGLKIRLDKTSIVCLAKVQRKTMPNHTHLAGNLLGSPRAESDNLLDRTFVETSDYHALTAKVDFNFVVGRRGAGKSALFRKAGEFLRVRPMSYCTATRRQSTLLWSFSGSLKGFRHTD